MTFRYLKIFLAVCDNEYNVTKAAKQLYLAQPAVSTAIGEMEAYYGVRLFDRISRRLYITEAGKRFREYALRISSLFDDLETGMRNWDAQGILRIGASISIGSQLLPEYVRRFSADHSGIDVRVRIGRTPVLEQCLLNNELDLALVEGTIQAKQLLCEAYMEDELTVICPAGSLFMQGQTISLSLFCKQRFLLREAESGTRQLFDHRMESIGRTVEPVWESASTSALINAVASGLGVSVLPKRMVNDALRNGRVVSIQVSGLEFRRKFYIVYHQNKFVTASASAFMNVCRRESVSHAGEAYEADNL